MFKVLNKQLLAQDTKRMDILAPSVARKIKTGQFVSVSPQEGDERIPLSVVEADGLKGTLSLIFQEVGFTTTKLGSMAINDPIFSILGPLGNPAQIEKKGTVVCIATGIGTAQILPICRALKNAGNKVIGVIGAKKKKELILEAQMRLSCQQLFITTNDGSYERRGLATDIVKTFLQQQKIDLVYAIGSVDMLQAVCQMTKEKNIPTRVVLNPMMVDCMGMCGSCRVQVGGEIVLACIEGPEFDGQKIDFEDLQIRMNAYEESALWGNQPLQHNQNPSESKILTRFLSGILRK